MRYFAALPALAASHTFTSEALAKKRYTHRPPTASKPASAGQMRHPGGGGNSK